MASKYQATFDMNRKLMLKLNYLDSQVRFVGDVQLNLQQLYMNVLDITNNVMDIEVKQKLLKDAYKNYKDTHEALTNQMEYRLNNWFEKMNGEMREEDMKW